MKQLVKRKYILGDEWVYFTIHSGISFQETLLSGELSEITFKLFRQGVVDKFFFVRYFDEDGPHLRVRYHLTKTVNLPIIIAMINDSLGQYVEYRAIHKIAFETYTRELERYGSDNIEDVESLFSINSVIILKLLKNKPPATLPYWLGIIVIVDDFLNQLNLSAYEKHELVELGYSKLFDKLLPTGVAKEDLKYQFRSHHSLIKDVIDNQHHPYRAVISTVDAFESLPYLNNIKARKNRYVDQPSFDYILISIIHMSINRYFSSNQNKYELVIYYMLSNYYKSLSIRQRVNPLSSLITEL